MFPDRPPLLTYSMTLRSRYSETDKMGVVYHSRYLEYFEVIRTEFIRKAGLPYSEMENNGIMLPVARVEIQFKQPIKYDELMDGRLYIFDEPTVKLVTCYDIRPAGSPKPAVLGKVELVFVNMQTKRPIRAPKEFIYQLQNYAKLA